MLPYDAKDKEKPRLFFTFNGFTQWCNNSNNRYSHLLRKYCTRVTADIHRGDGGQYIRKIAEREEVARSLNPYFQPTVTSRKRTLEDYSPSELLEYERLKDELERSRELTKELLRQTKEQTRQVKTETETAITKMCLSLSEELIEKEKKEWDTYDSNPLNRYLSRSVQDANKSRILRNLELSKQGRDFCANKLRRIAAGEFDFNNQQSQTSQCMTQIANITAADTPTTAAVVRAATQGSNNHDAMEVVVVHPHEEVHVDTQQAVVVPVPEVERLSYVYIEDLMKAKWDEFAEDERKRLFGNNQANYLRLNSTLGKTAKVWYIARHDGKEPTSVQRPGEKYPVNRYDERDRSWLTTMLTTDWTERVKKATTTAVAK